MVIFFHISISSFMVPSSFFAYLSSSSFCAFMRYYSHFITFSDITHIQLTYTLIHYSLFTFISTHFLILSFSHFPTPFYPQISNHHTNIPIHPPHILSSSLSLPPFIPPHSPSSPFTPPHPPSSPFTPPSFPLSPLPPSPSPSTSVSVGRRVCGRVCVSAGRGVGVWDCTTTAPLKDSSPVTKIQFDNAITVFLFFSFLFLTLTLGLLYKLAYFASYLPSFVNTHPHIFIIYALFK